MKREDGRAERLPVTTISVTSEPRPICSLNSKVCSVNTVKAVVARVATMCMTISKPSVTARLREPSPPGVTLPAATDLLFYEGLHGAASTDTIDVGRHVDLCVGVVPIINLEWIQKLHRDKAQRGYSTEAVVDTILRRMPEYINYICPQFSKTHVNFQRVPTVDTSNPFIAQDI
jgi:hypothetical protein